MANLTFSHFFSTFSNKLIINRYLFWYIVAKSIDRQSN